jgi:uncharacterized repeat protein (TIGR04138 family)
VKGGSSLDWPAIRSRAAEFPDEAFDFVREGLRHTAQTLHGGVDPAELPDERRHINGQQLCMGLRDFALRRYGLLAPTVLGRWKLRTTEDFGTLVYALIDRGELRASERDSIEDFKGVFEFGEAFRAVGIG